MIKTIDISNRKHARDVLNVQIPSYKVEAEIIGSYEIPPLKDTVYNLQHCEETFIGYYKNEQLCGGISIKIVDEEVDIHRLIVHPNHFRKGIAQMLLNFIESTFKVETIKVSTGSKNVPAVSFYKKNGFINIKEVMVKEQISITIFEKKL
ncbi:GNAT family N-acetyltransferase [Anaerobacillus arseniciselenatis]|uniref:GNAT family N-acetyltransferase n=1 Tax=Anaerobacillus arseniciselenatis TaxID=85682 RepID=A0A1S2LFV0_9BACI|nr:GNAT family N-acetyltransferase [Anaerobacillus arseniciselenatis]OIJ11120.1 GNAT family N-acetyltransferase [Anaerobacillus arseniciselenatis]